MVHSQKNTATREMVILQHSHLVEKIAFRLKRRVPAHVDFEELRSVGFIGLIEALDRYDDSKGVPFQAYAEIRINGSMLDYLRKEDWVPRSIRQQMKTLKEGKAILSEQGLECTDQNLANVLDLTMDETRKLLFEAQHRTVLSSGRSNSSEEMYFEDIVEDPSETVESTLLTKESKERLRDSIVELSERQRRVLEMYYFEGYNLKEIGLSFKITESRVCQIRKNAIKALQDKLAVEA